MARDSLRGFFQLGFFIGVGGLCSAYYAEPDSGEFVISICSSVIGLVLIGGAALTWRLLR